MPTEISTDGAEFVVQFLDRGYRGGPPREVFKVNGRTGDVEVIGRLRVNGAMVPGSTGAAAAAAPAPVAIQNDHFTPTTGQTAFLLSQTPTGEVQMYVNGARQDIGAGKDYTVAGRNVTWLDNGFQLAPSDAVVFTYPR